MEIVILVIQCVAGMIGGNGIGAVRTISLHTMGNTLLGVAGGIASGALVNQLGYGTGSLDSMVILINALGGFVGGFVVVFLIGALRFMLVDERR